MASQPLTGKVLAFPGYPPAAAAHIAGKLLNRHSPGEIAAAIDVLMDLLDCLDDDADAEPGTWVEDIRARLGNCCHEDAEDDDPLEQDDPAEDDDADEDGHDREREQLPDDVPCLPLYDADTRAYLGMNGGENFIGDPPSVR